MDPLIWYFGSLRRKLVAIYLVVVDEGPALVFDKLADLRHAVRRRRPRRRKRVEQIPGVPEIARSILEAHGMSREEIVVHWEAVRRHRRDSRTKSALKR